MKSGGRAHSFQLFSLCPSPLSLLPLSDHCCHRKLSTTISLSCCSDWRWRFDLKAIENMPTVQSLWVLVQLFLGATTVSDWAFWDFHTHPSVGLQEIYAILEKCETLTKYRWMVGLKAHAALWMIDNKYIYFSSFSFSSFQGKWQQPETQECKWYFYSRIISLCGKCMFEQQLL